MSTKSKGAAHEKKVADYLLAQGYQVERGFKKIAFIKGRMMAITKDLFAAFDIVAIKYVPDREVRFIQVHAQAGPGGGVAERKRKCFGTWPDSEMWQHIKSGFYLIHRDGGSESMVDVNVILKPKKQEIAA